MLCRKCSSEYEPTPEEARLINQGDLSPLCPECAPTPRAPPPLIEEPEDKATEVFWRAERTDANGNIIAAMRLPKKFVRPTVTPLVKPRKDLLHVFVLSESDPQFKSSSPRTILHTNLETFINDKQPFWVQKLPSYWDGPTGISRIEVPLEEVIDIIKENSLTRVQCQDGSEIRLYYR